MAETHLVRAIVFDANVFGRSVEPNIRTIESWAKACAEHDAELWIPEVVAWELAQRVSHESEEFARYVKAHNRRRRNWGFPPFDESEVLDEGAVIYRMRKAGAVIVDLSGDAALSAIRDQVLLLGPATRKQKVKTGAADSGWIRSVIEHNDGDADGLIFVTGDADAVTRTCVALGINDPRVAKNIGEIRPLLDELTEATPDQLAFFKMATGAVLTGPDAGPRLLELADVGRHNWWTPGLDVEADSRWQHLESDVMPYEVEVAGSVNFDAWSNSLSGDVRVDVIVEEQYASQDQWGEHPDYLSFIYGAWVEGVATVFVRPDSDPTISELVDVQLGVDRSSIESRAL